MQGLPINLLTQNAASNAGKTAGKADASASFGVNGKMAIPANGVTEKAQNSEGAKSDFASFFANLLGNTETKVEGGPEKGKGEKAEGEKTASNPEVKLDVLLKNKDQEKGKKTESTTLTSATALSPEVLKNIDNLIAKNPPADPKAEKAVGDKVAATSTNLEQLLKTLKGEEGVEQASEEGNVLGLPAKESSNKKGMSPLDFLLKQSAQPDVAVTEGKTLQANPETVSKLGLSSEDFLSHLSEGKEPKSTLVKQDVLNLDGDFDPKALGQRQMNQSMRAYGQKQNLLNDNVIRSTKDLAFKETKSKTGIDELKTPDMRITAETSQVKDPFIVGMQKQEPSQQNVSTQGSEKVLDLSKMSSSNTDAIIKKISDYIQQNNVGNKESLDLTVRHDSLGEFKIQVNRPVGSAPNAHMDMQITTTTSEGHDFFMKHEIGLMKNLSQAGIQLSDLRIVSETGSSAFAGNDSRQSGHSQNGSQAGREFMSFDSAGDSSHGSDRRRELWQEARNNQQRYGA